MSNSSFNVDASSSTTESESNEYTAGPCMMRRLNIASLVLKLDEPTRPGESFPDWLFRAQARYEMFFHVGMLVAALSFCLDGTACVDTVARVIAAAKTVQLALRICWGSDSYKWMQGPTCLAFLAIIASIIGAGRESETTSLLVWNHDKNYGAEFHVCQMRDESGFQKVLDSGFHFMISQLILMGFTFGLRKVNVRAEVSYSFWRHTLVFCAGAVAAAMLFAKASPKQNWTNDFHLQIPTIIISVTAFYGAILCSRLMVWHVWFPQFIEASQAHESGPKQVSSSSSGYGTGSGVDGISDCDFEAWFSEANVMGELNNDFSDDTPDTVLGSYKSSDSDNSPLSSPGPQSSDMSSERPTKVPRYTESELSWNRTKPAAAVENNRWQEYGPNMKMPAFPDLAAAYFQLQQVQSDDFSWRTLASGNPTQPGLPQSMTVKGEFTQNDINTPIGPSSVDSSTATAPGSDGSDGSDMLYFNNANCMKDVIVQSPISVPCSDDEIPESLPSTISNNAGIGLSSPPPPCELAFGPKLLDLHDASPSRSPQSAGQGGFTFITEDFNTINGKTDVAFKVEEVKVKEPGLSMAKLIDSVAVMDNAGNLCSWNPDFIFLATQIGNGMQCDGMPQLGNMMAKLLLLVKWKTMHANQAGIEFDEISEDNHFRIWGTVRRVGEHTLCTIQKYSIATQALSGNTTPDRPVHDAPMMHRPVHDAVPSSSIHHQQAETMINEALIDEAMIESLIDSHTAAPISSSIHHQQAETMVNEALIDEAMIERLIDSHTAAPISSWDTYKSRHKVYKYHDEMF